MMAGAIPGARSLFATGKPAGSAARLRHRPAGDPIGDLLPFLPTGDLPGAVTAGWEG
jgi:hypothetical protein